MKITDLPSPGLISMGLRLRIEAVKAISQTKIVAGLHPNGKSPYAGALKAFFDAASTAVATYVDSTAPATPSRVIGPTNPTKLVLTFAEEMAPSLPASLAAWTIAGTIAAGATTVTAQTWTTDRVLTLTLSKTIVAADTPTLAYTKPGSGAVIEDTVGNDLATFTAVAITNSVPA